MTDNTPTLVADDWDGHWSQFDRSAAANPAQHYRHRLLVRAVRGLRPRRLVDIGSGQGDLLGRMRRALPHTALFGLELSSTGVQRTLLKVPDADVRRIDLLDDDAATQISDVRADVAVCSEVLEHLDDPLAFLQAASAALKPGATMVVTVPSGPVSEFDRMIGHRRHYTPFALSLLLQSAGFIVTRVDRAGFPFFNLYRLVVIGRGNRLANDVAAGSTTWLAGVAMSVFDLLFHFNVARSRWGWQLVAVARRPVAKPGDARGI